MVDIERVKIMTKLATYEKGQGKKDIAMNRYSREDYIKYQMIWSSMAATVAFIIGCFLFLLLAIDWVMDLSSTASYIYLGGTICFLYIVFLFIYRKFLRKLYNKNYTNMTLRLEKYRRELKRLQELYELAEKK